MDKLRLMYEIKRNGYTVDTFCKQIGINKSTFYRKISENSKTEFTRLEIEKMINLLHLDSPMGIFFAEEVS